MVSERGFPAGPEQSALVPAAQLQRAFRSGDRDEAHMVQYTSSDRLVWRWNGENISANTITSIHADVNESTQRPAIFVYLAVEARMQTHV